MRILNDIAPEESMKELRAELSAIGKSIFEYVATSLTDCNGVSRDAPTQQSGSVKKKRLERKNSHWGEKKGCFVERDEEKNEEIKKCSRSLTFITGDTKMSSLLKTICELDELYYKNGLRHRNFKDTNSEDLWAIVSELDSCRAKASDISASEQVASYEFTPHYCTYSRSNNYGYNNVRNAQYLNISKYRKALGVYP